MPRAVSAPSMIIPGHLRYELSPYSERRNNPYGSS